MRTLLLTAVLCLTLAGCSSTTTNTSSSTSPTGMEGMDHSHMAAKTVDIALKGNKFVNETVTIYAGDTVKWTNQDSVGHSVTSDAGQTDSFDNKPSCAAGLLPGPVCMVSGDTFSHTFAKAGTTKYHCRAHSSTMVGTIIVQDHPMM